MITSWRFSVLERMGNGRVLLGAASLGVLLCVICKVLRPERYSGIQEGESDVEEDPEEDEDSPWALAEPPSAGPEEFCAMIRAPGINAFLGALRTTQQLLMAGVGDSKPNFEPSGETGPMKGIMARFWYSCAVFCAAALLLPLLTRTMVDDGSNGDIDLDLDADAGWSSGPSQSVQLGVTFFAIAVMLWTFIAAWFCYNSPFFPSEESIRRAKGPDEVANLDVSRSVLQRVAQGFADFIVENSRREDRTVGCNGEATTSLRGLDLAKFEELVAVAPAAAASALYGYKGTTPKKMFTKEFTPCSLSKECSCKGEIRGATPVDGKGSKEGTTIPQLDAPHLSLFKELLRDRLVANLMSEGGQKLSENGSEGMNWLGKSNLRSPSRWFAQSEPKGGDDTLDHLLRELLRSSGEVTVEEFPESRKEEMPFAASMADHARAIGDKCFKQQQFGAAVHCYEVATLLCPSGPLHREMKGEMSQQLGIS
eukprot:symbB.v1.2.021306.t1/scaffold1793.1/size101111/3